VRILLESAGAFRRSTSRNASLTALGSEHARSTNVCVARTDSLSDAVTGFNRAGFADDFYADGELLRSRSRGSLHAPETMTIESFARFEGTSDPDDQAILFALSGDDGSRGTYATAYGAGIDDRDAAIIARLR
jgi:hypothetical protein